MTEVYNSVVEILISLGVNSTFYYQFFIFFLAYVGMSQIVFKPYLAAYNERQNRTVGGQETAKSINSEADELENIYSTEARRLNEDIKKEFSSKMTAANSERNNIIEAARKDAENKIIKGREEIEEAVGVARTSLSPHIGEISKNIQNKFVRN